ncbi:MAG TPA: XRE family transcriptional regulator, partial [Chitinophagaceae bacterium]|nr:XRE family transcriptional regulator [Chitinophagaceae bacterium]
IAGNIRHLRQLRNWSQEQLATKLDIPRARIGSYEEERCAPPVETLVRMSNLFHVAIDALIKCDLRKFNEGDFIGIAENRMLFPVMVDSQNNDMVEVVTLKASAGYLRGYADPVFIEKLPVMQLPFHAEGKLRAFPIQGDSMLPLKSGSFVIGRFVESLKDIVNGNTYVLLTRDEGLLYKRLVRKGNQIELHSDNEEYPVQTIAAGEVVELWAFVCSLQRSDRKEPATGLDAVMQQLQKLQLAVTHLTKAGKSPVAAG